jgi:S-(hydroxymethyl)glutathione dehydrogenase / alcohol dehydrogenase
MLTRAAVLWETGAPLSVEEVELADPHAGEVRVRIAAAGVCRSDLHVMEGVWTYDLPMVLGHEGAGIVEAVGPGVLAPKVGDAVALA